MDDATRIRLEVLEEIMRELIRAEVLTDDMVDSVAERFAIRAENKAGTSTGESYAIAEHQVLCLPIEAAQPEHRESEKRAEFQRRQMRERTAMLNPTDGGKADE